MPVATKPCAKCTSPVADVALGRGAVQIPDGRRYCSVCVGELSKQQTPEADQIRRMVRRPARVEQAAPATAAASAPATAAASPEPAVPVTARPRASAAARRTPPPQKTAPNGKPTSRKRQRKKTDPDLATGHRTTVRNGSRSALPWYFRLSRAQLIGAGAGLAGLLLIALIVAVSGGDDSRRRERIVHRPVAPGTTEEVRYLMNEAYKLYSSGKRDEAVRRLEEAKQLAQKLGHDNLVQEINQKLYGLRFKTAN